MERNLLEQLEEVRQQQKEEFTEEYKEKPNKVRIKITMDGETAEKEGIKANGTHWQQIEGTTLLQNTETKEVVKLPYDYSEEQIEALKTKRRKKEGDRNFFMMYSNMFPYLEELTESELTYTFLLASKVDYHTNYNKDDDFIPFINSQKNKTPMSDQQIRKFLGLEKQKQNQIWHRLKSKCLAIGLWKEIEGNLCQNKYFYFKGKCPNNFKKDVVLMKVISVAINPNLTKTQKKAIGTMLKLSQFVNPINNSLCKNPYETDKDKIEYFKSVNELCKHCGITYGAYNQLWNCVIDGNCLIGIWFCAFGKRWILNYDLLFRNDYIRIIEELKNEKVDLSTLFKR